MPPDPAAVLRRRTGRLAPPERIRLAGLAA
jgi:hypothetical protein